MSTKHSPSGPVPLWGTQEPERLRPGKCKKHRVHLGQDPHRAPWSLGSVDLESTHCRGLWQTQGGPLMQALPTHALFFAMLLPLHSMVEQVSPNKWPPSPPHVRAEIKTLKRLANRGSQNKQRRGNHPGSDRCNKLKP